VMGVTELRAYPVAGDGRLCGVMALAEATALPPRAAPTGLRIENSLGVRLSAGQNAGGAAGRQDR
jgi:hypothetical protein